MLIMVSYCFASIGIIFVNKIILTSNKFPSPLFLCACQLLSTSLALHIAGKIGATTIASTDSVSFRQVLPLSLLYMTDVTMGLMGTQSLSLPLFSALRRFSNLFILLGEYLCFKLRRGNSTYLAVFVMVFGAIIAASGDLAFDSLGYTIVFINNLSTAGKGLLTKSRLSDLGFSSTTLLFYNSILVLPLICIAIVISGDVHKVLAFPLWYNPLFVLGFLFSCFAAVALQYLLFECTKLTSALTTSIIGVMKNVFVTYVGMFVGGDYIFTITNFCGLTLSAFGAIMYAYVTYKAQTADAQLKKAPILST